MIIFKILQCLFAGFISKIMIFRVWSKGKKSLEKIKGWAKVEIQQI